MIKHDNIQESNKIFNIKNFCHVLNLTPSEFESKIWKEKEILSEFFYLHLYSIHLKQVLKFQFNRILKLKIVDAARPSFIKQKIKVDLVTNQQIKCNLFLLTCLYWKREPAEQPILSLFGYLFLHYLLLFQNLGVGLQSQGAVATEIKTKFLAKEEHLITSRNTTQSNLLSL